MRSKVITGAEGPIGRQVMKVVKENLAPESALHTDAASHYRRIYASASHEEINHQISYARWGSDGERVHVNTAEGYFSIFKRGLVGTYQHMSSQHLHRYLAEFDFRMSNRARLGVNDTMRAEKALKGVVGKRLTYRTPSGHQA